MKKLMMMIFCAMLLTIAACAEEAPPVFLLDRGGVTETPAAAYCSWTGANGETSEWTGGGTGGKAPTDPAVSDALDPVLLMEDEPCGVIWVGTPADELIAYSWDAAVFSDPEHPDAYRQNAEIILGKTDGRITLKPDRVYDFQASWLDENGAHGVAHYYLVTERLIMDDGPGSVILGGWEPAALEPRPLPADAQAAFDKAMEGLVGVRMTPAVLLSTQAVAGTNYCILCQVSPVVPDPTPAWALVYIRADPEGNAQMTHVYELYIERHADPEGGA